MKKEMISKFIIGIFIIFSLTNVFAGNVIVKEGSITIEDDFNSSNIFFINKTTGNIGIGITTPQNPLNVLGIINGTGNITAGGFFVGDGRFLTNLPADSESDPQWTANITNYFTKAQWNATNLSYLTNYNTSVMKIWQWNATNISYRTLNNITFVGNMTSTSDFCISGGNCLSGTGGATNTSYLTNYGDTATGNYTFSGGGYNTFFIDNTYNRVGIGTTSPKKPLHIAGAPSGGGGIVIDVTHSTDAAFIWFYRQATERAFIALGSSNELNFGTAGANRMTILQNGNIGIGTTTPADKLTIVGDVNASGCFQLPNGTIIGGSCVSDISTKNNVKDYSINVSRLLLLSPKEFEYKNTSIFAGIRNYTIIEEIFDEKTNETKLVNKTISEEIYYNFPEGTQKGFIADEIEEVYPEFVETDEFGFKRVIYGTNWILELWKQNQEQQNLLNQQANEIDMLKSELCVKDNTHSWCEK